MAMGAKHHTADQGVPTELRAGGGGLFRLRRAWPDRRHTRSVDQRKPVVHARTTRGNRRLAYAALDRENGVRGTRRHCADVRLTPKILHPHRRTVDGHRPAAAGRWLTFARPDQLYVGGAMVLVSGTVLQDVVADAMSTEVVPRTDTAGNERPDDSVRAELGMVQVLSRLAVSAGVLAVAGLSGWLASFM